LVIPKGYYDDIKYKIDVVITNEQIDVATKLTTLQTILTIIGTNPTILQDPRTKKVFYQLLDLAGISPIQFEQEIPSLTEVSIVEGGRVAERGGGIPKIPPITTPTATIETTRV